MITIDNNKVVATSPEGQQATMSLEKFSDVLLSRARFSTSSVILPDGIKAIIPGQNMSIVVHQTPPRVWGMKWIAADSPSPYGGGTKYRTVSIALPYVITMALFDGNGLGSRSECFFTNEPLGSLDDMLLAPGLLNCSKYPEARANGKPLAWICVQHLPFGKCRTGDQNKQIRLGLRELLKCLFETGFNLSSENHEGNSWFTESATVQKIDKRIETVEKWEKASAKNPMMGTTVPWIPMNLSVAQMAERMFGINGDKKAPVTQASLERIVFNQTSDCIAPAPITVEGWGSVDALKKQGKKVKEPEWIIPKQPTNLNLDALEKLLKDIQASKAPVISVSDWESESLIVNNPPPDEKPF